MFFVETKTFILKIFSIVIVEFLLRIQSLTNGKKE